MGASTVRKECFQNRKRLWKGSRCVTSSKRQQKCKTHLPPDPDVKAAEEDLLQHLRARGVSHCLLEQLEAELGRRQAHMRHNTQLAQVYRSIRTGDIEVKLNGLNGNLGTLRANAFMTIDSFKSLIERVTSIPKELQKLVLGTKILGTAPSANGLTPVGAEGVSALTKELHVLKSGRDCWSVAWSGRHQRYYFQNVHTNESSWHRPEGCDFSLPVTPPQNCSQQEILAVQTELAEGWTVDWDCHHKRMYFFHRESGRRSWRKYDAV